MSIRIKVLTACLLPFLSACATLESVDQGLYSATSSVTQRDNITGMRTISSQNRSEQIKEADAEIESFIKEVRAAGKKLNEKASPIAYKRIKRIFTRLHDVSHLRDEQWTPILVENNEWNAFTNGGTYFVIYSELEKDLRDDDELANVIAHEMAHTIANHRFEKQSYIKFNKLAGSSSAKRDTFKAAFTHENEAEADRIAVLYCALAGFDPFAGARIWKKKHNKEGNDAQHINDHPMNSERASLAQHTASLAAKYYSPHKINPNFKDILTSNDVFATQSSSKMEAGRGGGIQSALETALTTLKQKAQANQEEQRQQIRIQTIQSIKRLSRIVKSSQSGPNSWRITINYTGNRSLTDLGFKLTVNRNGLPPLVIVRQIEGILSPNSTFDVNFESPELEAYRTDNRNVSLEYDEARII